MVKFYCLLMVLLMNPSLAHALPMAGGGAYADKERDLSFLRHICGLADTKGKTEAGAGDGEALPGAEETAEKEAPAALPQAEKSVPQDTEVYAVPQDDAAGFPPEETVDNNGESQTTMPEGLEPERLTKEVEEPEEQIENAFVHGIRELDELTVPLEFKKAVDHYITYFSIKKRKMFERWLERERRYTPLLRKILRDHDLPEDLVYLAMIESGFNTKAYSRMSASGAWQFIAAKRDSVTASGSITGWMREEIWRRQRSLPPAT